MFFKHLRGFLDPEKLAAVCLLKLEFKRGISFSFIFALSVCLQLLGRLVRSAFNFKSDSRLFRFSSSRRLNSILAKVTPLVERAVTAHCGLDELVLLVFAGTSFEIIPCLFLFICGNIGDFETRLGRFLGVVVIDLIIAMAAVTSSEVSS